MYGHRRLLRIAVLCLVAGSVLVAWSPSFEVLLVGRVLQGPLAALLPLEIGLVRDRLDAAGARSAIALLVGALTFGASAGMVFAGLLREVISSVHGVLWIPAATTVLCAGAVFFLVPESKTRAPGRVDWAGAGLLSVGLATLLLGISQGPKWGWTDAWTLTLFAVAACTLVVWVLVELRVAEPIVDIRLTVQRTLLPVYAESFLLGTALFGAQTAAVLFMSSPGEKLGYGFGYDALGIAWLMLPTGVMAFAASLVASRLFRLIGGRGALALSGLLMAVGYVFLIVAHDEPWQFVVVNGIVGAGVGSRPQRHARPDRRLQPARAHRDRHRHLQHRQDGGRFRRGSRLRGHPHRPHVPGHRDPDGRRLRRRVVVLRRRVGPGRRRGRSRGPAPDRRQLTHHPAPIRTFQGRNSAMPAPTTPVLLHNGLLIDGTGAEPVRDGAVLIEDGRVRWAGPAADCPGTPEGTRRIDVRGDTILPGFIDCHVHMAAPGTAMSHAEIATLPRSLLTFLAAPRMKQTLDAGVTTARDLGGADAGHRRAVETGLLVGPRLLVAVAMLSPTGGHGDFRSGNDDRANDTTMGRLADGDAECRRAVRGVLRQGADCVKIAATGGVWSPTDQPDDDGFLEDEIRTITAIAAGHRGKKVAAHAHEIGTLEPGKRADVVIARGNPLDDIRALGDPGNVLLVMKDGVAYKDVDGLAT